MRRRPPQTITALRNKYERLIAVKRASKLAARYEHHKIKAEAEAALLRRVVTDLERIERASA